MSGSGVTKVFVAREVECYLQYLGFLINYSRVDILF